MARHTAKINTGLTLSISASAIMLASTSYAATIGYTDVYSGQNERLSASIEVSDISADNFSAYIANQSVYQQMQLEDSLDVDVKFQPLSSNTGKLLLTSKMPVTEPFADVVLMLKNNGKVQPVPKTLLFPLKKLVKPVKLNPELTASTKPVPTSTKAQAEIKQQLSIKKLVQAQKTATKATLTAPVVTANNLQRQPKRNAPENNTPTYQPKIELDFFASPKPHGPVLPSALEATYQSNNLLISEGRTISHAGAPRRRRPQNVTIKANTDQYNRVASRKTEQPTTTQTRPDDTVTIHAPNAVDAQTKILSVQETRRIQTLEGKTITTTVVNNGMKQQPLEEAKPLKQKQSTEKQDTPTSTVQVPETPKQHNTNPQPPQKNIPEPAPTLESAGVKQDNNQVVNINENSM